jgi:serine/threonine protein phosphatase 1
MTVDPVSEASLARPAAVPDGTAVYAIGDIHGRADLLAELHRRIADDRERGAVVRRVIVYLGDYVDRGDDSAGVIDLVIEGVPDGFEAVHLLGNHERLMLDFWADTIHGPVWLSNGGDATLRSYGVELGEGSLPRGPKLVELQAEMRRALPARDLAFLKGLQLSHVEGDYLFVHAGVRPGVRLEDQREADMIWIRSLFLDSTLDHGRIVVHGHTIVPEPVFRPNRIDIDTGAYASGRLTCLVLEGTKRRIIATGA